MNHRDSTGFQADDRPERVQGDEAGGVPSRRGFLRRTATAAAGTGAVLVAGTTAQAQASRRRPPQQRPPQFEIDQNTASLLRSIRQHENDHVAFLVNALGLQARPKPTFVNLLQNSPRDFLVQATIFENIGVGAYLAGLPLLANSPFLADTGSIALVEARHAGALNRVLNLPVTGNQAPGANAPSFEPPLAPSYVVALARPFIANLNGGGDPTRLSGPIDVLNFALLLEYLEAEFYNLNVQRFLRG